MFEHIIFYDRFQTICHHKLKSNFLLITTLSDTYDKFAHNQGGKFNMFNLKTFMLHWVRIAFKGKGYRLRKFKGLNKVTLNFGHSHWAKLALNPNLYFFKKIRRQNYLCIMKYFDNYKNFKNNIKFYKPLNVYTRRGLRLKKQFIRRRFGKISQVVSSLH